MATEQDMIDDVRNSMLTKYVGVAGFTVLVWDHIISFDLEVEYIWKGGKGLAVYLFFFSRYFIPLSFCVNIYAYFSTSWSLRSCHTFVRYEGAMTMIGISVVALMMFLRIRALYARVLSIQAIVLAIFFTFIGVNSYLLTRGIPVQHVTGSGVDSCTMIIDPKVPGPIASSSAWLPLLYDTIVFLLTLNRTASSIYSSSRNSSQMFRVLLEQGLVYYLVICTITLILTIQITVHADQSIRNITAQLHLCFTVAMMSRISLGLRQFARRPNGVINHDAPRRPFGHRRFPSPDPQVSIAPPTFAMPATRSTPHVTFMNDHSNDAPVAPTTSENDPYFAMDTFSGTVTKEFDA